MNDKPLFYLSGNTIHKRPVTRKAENSESIAVISVGFPVCTVSEFVDAEEVLHIFNAYVS